MKLFKGVKMKEKKEQLDQLTRNDQKEVKGGIPYEQPGLIELSTTAGECGVGMHCSTGDISTHTCVDGSTCSQGVHSGGGGPSPDPEPNLC